jgi:hypothetical protein
MSLLGSEPEKQQIEGLHPEFEKSDSEKKSSNYAVIDGGP